MTRRLQLLLDEERYQRVLSAATAQHVSVAAVIRHAIDESVREELPDKRAAFEAIMAAEPMEVPDPEELVAELNEVRGREGRW